LQLDGRARARGVVASILGLWLLACVALGARHETETGHWADRQGNLHHAVRSSCTNEGPDADVHAATGRVDHDACELAAARHAVARPTLAVQPSVQPPDRPFAWIAPSDDELVVITARYRFAPKTSPPAV